MQKKKKDTPNVSLSVFLTTQFTRLLSKVTFLFWGWGGGGVGGSFLPDYCKKKEEKEKKKKQQLLTNVLYTTVLLNSQI